MSRRRTAEGQQVFKIFCAGPEIFQSFVLPNLGGSKLVIIFLLIGLFVFEGCVNGGVRLYWIEFFYRLSESITADGSLSEFIVNVVDILIPWYTPGVVPFQAGFHLGNLILILGSVGGITEQSVKFQRSPDVFTGVSAVDQIFLLDQRFVLSQPETPHLLCRKGVILTPAVRFVTLTVFQHPFQPEGYGREHLVPIFISFRRQIQELFHPDRAGKRRIIIVNNGEAGSAAGGCINL